MLRKNKEDFKDGQGDRCINRQRDRSQVDRRGENSIPLKNIGSILQQPKKSRK